MVHVSDQFIAFDITYVCVVGVIIFYSQISLIKGQNKHEKYGLYR